MGILVDKRIARFLGRILPGIDFSVVRDSRDKAKVERGPKELLGAAFIGILGGSTGFGETERLRSSLSSTIRKYLGIRGRVPDTTLRDYMTKVDFSGLQDLLRSNAQAAFRSKSLHGFSAGLPTGMAAFDGKYDRVFVPLADNEDFASQRAKSVELYPYVQFDKEPRNGRLYGEVRSLSMCLVAPAGALYVDCVPVLGTTNEMGTFPEAIRRFREDWGNRNLVELLSVDAGSVSKENADLVDEAGFGYLMAIKNTQPTILEELERLFGNSDPTFTHRQRYRGGWVEFRLWRTSEIAGWHDWTHLKQGFCIERITLDADFNEKSREKRYFITNINYCRFSNEEWAALIRAHWMVENGAHWALDMGMQEGEHPWTQQPHAMLAMALLRRLAHAILTLLRVCYLRAGEERKPAWHRLMEAIRDILRLAEPEHLLRKRRRTAVLK